MLGTSSAKAMFDAGYSLEQVESMIRIRRILGTCQIVAFASFLLWLAWGSNDAASTAEGLVPTETGVAEVCHVDEPWHSDLIQ